MSIKQDLPSYYGSEGEEYSRLLERGTERTKTGVFTFESETGTKESYTSFTGEEGMFTILNTLLNESLVYAEDFNQISEPVIVDGELSGVISITTGGAFEKFTLELTEDLTDLGGFSISRNGNTAKALKNVDGTNVTELLFDRLYYGIVEKVSAFYMVPSGSGTGIIPFLGKTLTETGSSVIDRTTPVQVVNQAYSTLGNGGRRGVVLDNGWIVEALYDSGNTQIIFSVDKNDGNDFNQLCYLDGTVDDRVSIVTDGTHIYILLSNNNIVVQTNSFNATTIGNVNVYESNKQFLDGGFNYTSLDSVSLAISDDLLNVTAIYGAVKNTHPNSNNIWAQQGTISSGVITWGSVEQLTTGNVSDIDSIAPTVIYKDDGYPIIAYAYDQYTGSHRIATQSFNGASWTYKTIYEGGTYEQERPSADTLSDGTIIVSWDGRDATDTSANNIRFSQSVDDGVNWSAMEKLTSGNLYNQAFASITRNTVDEIFITFDNYDGSTIQVGLISGTSGAFAQSQITTTLTGVNSRFSSTCNNYRNFEKPITIFKDPLLTQVLFYGKWTVIDYDQTILSDKVKSGVYVYANQETNLVLDSPQESVIDRTTPVQVTANAYTTTASARPVRMDNGWLKSFTQNGLVVYVSTSKDNGATWSATSTMAGGVTGGYSVVSLGSTYALLYTSTSVMAVEIRDVDDVIVGTPVYNVDSAQTELGGCSITIAPNGDLHATWSSKNASYPNSFNTRYSKSSDGGGTWDAPTQISALNNTGFDKKAPVIVINSSGNPVIIDVLQGTGAYTVNASYFNGTVWVKDVVIDNPATYIADRPSADVLSDGTIIVSWNGRSAGNPSYTDIYFSQSTDATGASWSTAEKLTPGGNYDMLESSITRDSNDEIFIMFRGKSIAYPAFGNIYLVQGISGAFGTQQAITTSTTAHSFFPATANNYRNFDKPFTIWTGYLVDVKFYGKWSETLTEQVIPSIETATNESELVALDSGTLKTIGSLNKIYSGNIDKNSQGFTPVIA